MKYNCTSHIQGTGRIPVERGGVRAAMITSLGVGGAVGAADASAPGTVASSARWQLALWRPQASAEEALAGVRAGMARGQREADATSQY